METGSIAALISQRSVPPSFCSAKCHVSHALARIDTLPNLFNAFNQVNVNNPSVTATNTDFGRVTSVGPPRNVQLALRLTF
jgi:hypothetical protein